MSVSLDRLFRARSVAGEVEKLFDLTDRLAPFIDKVEVGNDRAELIRIVKDYGDVAVRLSSLL